MTMAICESPNQNNYNQSIAAQHASKGDSEILPIGISGVALGGIFGLVIGTVIDGVTMDSYDLTKMTTAPKALLLTDLLVSGTSTRR